MNMSKKSAGLIIGGIVLFILLVAAKSYVTLSEGGSRISFGGSKVGYAEDAMMVGGNTGYATDSFAPEMAMRSIAPSPMPPMYDGAGKTAAEVDQRIIKTGSVSLIVNDVREASTRIITLAKGAGGFVQDSSVSEREDGTSFGNVTVRVPAAKFESSLTDIRALATLVQNESINGQDVTEQYSDLQAQIKNAKAQESQYLEILKQARSVEDILSVQRELGNIRSQIESLQGRIQYLENVTSYSTISVFLSEEPTFNIPTKEFRPVTIIKEAFQALGVLAQEMATFVIWFVVIGAGVMIPSLLLAYLLYRLVRRFIMSRRPPMNLRR